MKVEIDLNNLSGSVNSAIKDIQNYKNTLNKKVQQLLNHIAKEGETIAKTLLVHIDTGATLKSIKGYREGNKAIIVAGENAIWIEFGTGIIKNGAGFNHPVAEQVGMSAHGTYGQGKGANPYGWWYMDDDGEFKHTKGIEANLFMWNTGETLREKIPQYVKDIFK